MKKILLILLFSFSLVNSQVVKLVDSYSKENVNFEKIEQLPNGAKIDNILFARKGNVLYKRVLGSNISVKWFGAKGDGKTDDTEAIQKALDAVGTLNEEQGLLGTTRYGGGRVYFPNGKYLISKTLVLPNYVEMVGESKNNTMIFAHKGMLGVTNVRGFAENGVDMLMSRNNKVKDLTFAWAALKFTQCWDLEIDNVNIVNTINTSDFALKLEYGVNYTIKKVKIVNAGIGVFISDTPGAGPTTTNYLENVWVQTSNIGLKMDGLYTGSHLIQTTTVFNSIFEYCDVGIILQGKLRNVKIENIHFEQNNTLDMQIYDSAKLILSNFWTDTTKGIRFYKSDYTDSEVSFYDVPLNISFLGEYVGKFHRYGFKSDITFPQTVTVTNE